MSTLSNVLTTKLATVDETMTITICDNGFIFDVSGRDANEDYSSAKIVCDDIDQLISLITEATKMERN
jgi:hypothetical protein